ncbi:hypothetical protein B0I37DRAFT_366022 [Chaetomium sp. MPI-CAGE-AT-0009]|nr:hypothetical protein B0I37DRAFT_366022 [Chaetomium sp. MPI-CAGE-AT-0009]
MSRPCLERFEERFRELNIGGSLRERHKSTTVWTKARWVIQDKRKFEELISDLAHFTTKLRQIVPPAPTSLARTAELSYTKDLEQIHGLSKLRFLLEASTGHRGAIAEPAQELIDRICQDRILRSLWFRKMDDRRESIRPAHEKTFQWVFEPAPDPKDPEWEDLESWLRVDSGIYWVSGKAGSGKSTFMKYLRSAPQTAALLSEWAGREECTIADFFFYYLGTPEQNTQAGLSKALLFKILSRYPALVSKALPNLWKEANQGREEDLTPPSPAEIGYAFEVISTHRNLPPFCILIDGLDEYVGEPRDGIALIHRLAMNPRLKIIVSSRPEPHCVAAFRDLPKLELQSLTKGDITAYVEEVIGQDRYMKDLLRNEPEQSKSIMLDIIHKASGVFLWVVLACRSVLDGCDDYDSIQELRDRVEGLPEHLKDMFSQMLRRVDKRHAHQASKLLHLAFMHWKTQDRDSAELNALYGLEVVFIVDYLESRSAPLRFMDEPEREEACKRLEGRLRSRCGGLLELARRGRGEHHSSSFCFCSAADWGNKELSMPTAHALAGESAHDDFDATVTFMHRSVADFLETDEAREYLKTSTAEFDFPGVMSLSRLYLAMQSQRLRCPEELHQLLTCLQDGITWGAEADWARPEGRENIFWKMVPCLDLLRSADGPVFGLWSGQLGALSEAHSHERSDIFSHATLIIAIEAGAGNYLRQHPSLPSMASANEPPCGCLPLLYYAIESNSLLGLQFANDDRLVPWKSRRSAYSMIRILLDAGCDPNGTVPDWLHHSGVGGQRPTGAVTAWTSWLRKNAAKLSLPSAAAVTSREKAAMLEDLEAFFHAGADLKSTEGEIDSIRRAMWPDWEVRAQLTRAMKVYQERTEAEGMSHSIDWQVPPASGTKRSFESIVGDMDRKRSRH